MSQLTMRHLHMGCGESLSAVQPMERRERPQSDQEKLRTGKPELQDKRVQKEKGAGF